MEVVNFDNVNANVDRLVVSVAFTVVRDKLHTRCLGDLILK